MNTKRKGPPISVNAAKCVGCLMCALRCSLRFEKAFNIEAAAVMVRRQIQSANEYEVSFSDLCDNCGLCVQFCSYGALTQERQAGF